MQFWSTLNLWSLFFVFCETYSSIESHLPAVFECFHNTISDWTTTIWFKWYKKWHSKKTSCRISCEAFASCKHLFSGERDRTLSLYTCYWCFVLVESFNLTKCLLWKENPATERYHWHINVLYERHFNSTIEQNKKSQTCESKCHEPKPMISSKFNISEPMRYRFRFQKKAEECRLVFTSKSNGGG